MCEYIFFSVYSENRQMAESAADLKCPRKRQRLLPEGCRDGEVVRALASHSCGLGSISRLGVIMWVEFVGSLLCTEKFLSGYSGFPSPQKPILDLICVNC